MRSWTHLERQRGGFGFLGGPGETQIESDRRVISERIWKIEAELEKVKKRRNLHRAGRERVPYAPAVGGANHLRDEVGRDGKKFSIPASALSYGRGGRRPLPTTFPFAYPTQSSCDPPPP